MEDKIATASAVLTHGWVREYFGELMRALAARRGAKVAVVRLEHAFVFFAKLDATHRRPEDVTATSLFEAFGSREALRRHSTAIDFLRISQKVSDTTRENLEALQLDRRVDCILQRQKGAWYGKLLEELVLSYRKLQDKRRKRGGRNQVRPRTIVGAITASERFFQFATAHGAESLLSIEQQHIDLFLGAYPGYRCAFSSVFERLKRFAKPLRRLRVELPARRMPAELLLGPDEQRVLLERCISAEDRTLGLAAPIALLLVFPVHAVRLLRLQRSDVLEQADGALTIRFHKVNVPAPTEITHLLRRYLKRSEGLETFSTPQGEALLFPGHTAGHHRTTNSLRYFLGPLKLSQLFASALYGTFMAGLRQPSVLTDAFGLTSVTVVKYLTLFEPQVQVQAAKALGLRAKWIPNSVGGAHPIAG